MKANHEVRRSWMSNTFRRMYLSSESSSRLVFLCMYSNLVPKPINQVTTHFIVTHLLISQGLIAWITHWDALTVPHSGNSYNLFKWFNYSCAQIYVNDLMNCYTRNDWKRFLIFSLEENIIHMTIFYENKRK